MRSKSLMGIVGLLSIFSLSGNAFAESDKKEKGFILPVIKNATDIIPRIDLESFEGSLYMGSMKVIQDSSASSTLGFRMAYHVNEIFFLEGDVAQLLVNKTSRTTVDEKNSETTSLKYDFSIGANLFPGELFITKEWITPIYFYVIAGAGTMSIDDQDTSTISGGGGLRWLPVDYLSVRFDYRLRNYTDITQDGNPPKVTPGEASLGLSFYF